MRMTLLFAALVAAGCGAMEAEGADAGPTGAVAGSPGTGGRDASAGGAGASGGAGGSTSSGGTAVAGGGASPWGGGTGPVVIPDASSPEVIRDVPPGVELVPRDDIDPPLTTPLPYLLPTLGYLPGSGPDALPGRPEVPCDQCRPDEYCVGSPYLRQPAWVACPEIPTILTLGGTGCVPRPTACESDCPIVVCGCDGKFYCNACIAAAWGSYVDVFQCGTLDGHRR